MQRAPLARFSRPGAEPNQFQSEPNRYYISMPLSVSVCVCQHMKQPQWYCNSIVSFLVRNYTLVGYGYVSMATSSIAGNLQLAHRWTIANIERSALITLLYRCFHVFSASLHAGVFVIFLPDIAPRWTKRTPREGYV